MDSKLKKKFAALFLLLAFLICLLIGLLVQVLFAPKDSTQTSEADTKLFGLLNDEVVEQFPVITEEDMKEEIASRPPISQTLENQINSTVVRYLEDGTFDTLDQYLSDIENSYRGSDDLNGITLEDIQYMRADLSMIQDMTPMSSQTMMQSFHNPDFLIAAMVYEPISNKYKAMLHLDSLVIQPPEGSLPIMFTEQSVSDDVVSEILDGMNNLKNQQLYDKIKVYTCTLYGADFQYIIGHNVFQNTWSAYLVQCDDPRAYTGFHTCLAYQNMIKEGYIEEEMLDRSFFAVNISDIPESGENTFSEQNPDGTPVSGQLIAPPFDLHLQNAESESNTDEQN